MKLSKNECAVVVTKVLNGFILEMYDESSNLLFKAVASDTSMRGYNMDSLCSAFELCWLQLDKIIAEQQSKVEVPVEANSDSVIAAAEAYNASQKVSQYKYP